MSLATATLERFTTVTAALTPPTETPVVRDPTGPEANRPGTNWDYMLFVTRLDLGETREDLIGTVVTATPSPSQDGWFYRTPNGNLIRLYGAPLNTGMENGHYYRSLNPAGVLVRYNDDDHAGDRNIASLPLSIIAANGTTWPVPDDGTTMWGDTVPYIEVEAPATPELMDVPQFVEDTSANGPTRGFAAAEEDGRVLLDPPLVAGEQYIYWSASRTWERGSMSECRIVNTIAEDGTPTFGHLGYWTMERVDGTDVPYFYTSRRTVLDSETDKHWVKLALTTPTPTAFDAAPFTNAMAREAETFKEFNDATNELADDNDWCSDYESIVEKLGMEGRHNKVRDWTVTVDATFSFEADSVSNTIDRAVANDYDIPGISLNSARFRGSARITINVSEQRSEDAVREYIDTNEVYEALSNTMSGVDDIEVDDYNIYTIEEDD